MLLAALKLHGVEPEDALMVGYDFVDRQAADEAGVDYIDQQHLLGVENFDPGFDVCKMGERLVRPGTAPGVFAPGAFAAEARRAEAKGKPVPRSPQAAGGR